MEARTGNFLDVQILLRVFIYLYFVAYPMATKSSSSPKTQLSYCTDQSYFGGYFLKRLCNIIACVILARFHCVADFIYCTVLLTYSAAL